MRHHSHNLSFKYVQEPIEFNKNTSKDLLQYCLGATLYMPGTKNFVDKIINKDLQGMTSMVMCFEDAICEGDLPCAEANVFSHLSMISSALKDGIINQDDVPLIFIRVRNPNQFISFSHKLSNEQASVLSGFVFPKFYSSNGDNYLHHLIMLNEKLKVTLYGMPILEGTTIALKESRLEELCQIKDILKPYRDLILNIRVGGTDFSSIFGMRRGINYSIYDILTVRDCLSDILNFFVRVGEEYIVSGPVWEYFLAYKKDNIDNLLDIDIHRSLLNRNTILNEAIDGLLREVILDKANGFVGKTIIHPSHLKYVNAMQAVTREEYDDAMQIMQTSGGVVKSAKANKMNEISPHKNWAKKITFKAQAYGVIEDEASYLKLIFE